MIRSIIPIANIDTILDYSAPVHQDEPVVDYWNRPLRDLRISVTDRCNFRCTYCMPRSVFDSTYQFLPKASYLSIDEVERLAKIFVHLGVEKIRLTGGEPLLRKDIEFFVERLARLSTSEGRPIELAITTNGSILARKASALKNAGLARVTISLDALDDTTFRRMSDADYPVSDVLNGIESAQRVGLSPLKVNMVVKAGVNDKEIVPVARRFKGTGVIVRFIEYMDVGTSNGWNMSEVLPAVEIIRRISDHFPLEEIESVKPSDTARRYVYSDGSGEIGVVASVTRAFCGECTRARLSVEGKLYLCLFGRTGYDLHELINRGLSDEQIGIAVKNLWRLRADRYSELRGSSVQKLEGSLSRRIEMSYIGG